MLSQLSHFMIFWEASPDPIPIILTFFILLWFFCFCYKTSLVLSSLHAWQGHIFAFWMGIHCAFLIPDSCDPAEIPAESYGFPSQRWVSHGPPRKNNSNSVSHRLSKQSLRRIRGDASCFLGAVGKAPSCLPR